MKLLVLFSGIFLFANCSGDKPEQATDVFELSNESEIVQTLDKTIDDELIYEPEMSYVDSVFVFIDSAESEHNKAPVERQFSNEKWTYNKVNDSLEIVVITYSKHKKFYSEEYILLNSSLIYAIEWVEYISGEDITSWNCEYFIKENEIVDYNSLGHGETESDEWEPESIFDQWELREELFNEVSER